MSGDRALSFGSVAATYARARPGYPDAAIDFALAGRPRSTVLDLGAGTGKLTESLVGRAQTVVAVEPDAEMLAELRQRLPEVTAQQGSAEHTGLQAGSVDAVVVGQAFHWFARPAADFELARILRPGGALGLLWNFPDRDVAWIEAVFEATDGASPARYPHQRLAYGTFGEPEQRVFPDRHLMAGRDGVLEFVRTLSWVISQSPAQRAETERRVDAVLEQYGLAHQAEIELITSTKVIRYLRR